MKRLWQTRGVALLMGLLALTGCATAADELPPTALITPANPASVPTATAAGGTDTLVSLDNASLRYSPVLASTVVTSSVAMLPNNPNTPPGDETPPYTLFTFEDPPFVPPTPLFEPEVRVYAAADFANFGAVDEIGTFSYQLDALDTLLTTRPDPTQTAELPFLPPLPAAQVFRGQVAFVDFASGSGVRYLTAYAQAADPVLEGQVFYVFQGLTSDRRHVVTMTFPVATGVLPASAAPDAVLDPQALAAQINAVPADAFNPPLAALDRLVSSITVQ